MYSRRLVLVGLVVTTVTLFLSSAEAVKFSPSLRRRPLIFTKTSKSVFVSLRGGSDTPFKIQEPTSVGDGTATIPNEVFNLVKSIVGAGVLGLPAGIAAFGNAPGALLPSAGLVIFIGMLSAYGFRNIGRVCAYTNSSSYREAWNKCISPQTSWLPALCCLLVTFCSVLAYSIILCDTLPQLVRAAVGDSGSLLVPTRTQALLGVTTIVLLPLCLMKELKKLAPFSLVGILGMCYTSIAMAVRFFDGSYAAGGKFLAHVPSDLKPSFGTKGAANALNANVFVLVGMLSTAYMAHYNAPKFFDELKNNTLARFDTVVWSSFGISILIFISVASLGFLTFGQASSGLVLNNYSIQDTVMSLSKIAVAISIIFSYPLAFVGVRDGVLDLAQVPTSKRTSGLLDMLTVILLGIVTGLAYFLRDLRMIFALGGATWGNLVIYQFPSLMLIQCSSHIESLKKEVPLVTATGFLGLVMGVIGASRALQV